jgi:hypothetical protein
VVFMFFSNMVDNGDFIRVKCVIWSSIDLDCV